MVLFLLNLVLIFVAFCGGLALVFVTCMVVWAWGLIAALLRGLVCVCAVGW